MEELKEIQKRFEKLSKELPSIEKIFEEKERTNKLLQETYKDYESRGLFEDKREIIFQPLTSKDLKDLTSIEYYRLSSLEIQQERIEKAISKFYELDNAIFACTFSPKN